MGRRAPGDEVIEALCEEAWQVAASIASESDGSARREDLLLRLAEYEQVPRESPDY